MPFVQWLLTGGEGSIGAILRFLAVALGLYFRGIWSYNCDPNNTFVAIIQYHFDETIGFTCCDCATNGTKRSGNA